MTVVDEIASISLQSYKKAKKPMGSFEKLITTRAATLRIELLQFLRLPELLKIARLSKRAYLFVDPNSHRYGSPEKAKVKLHLARLAYHYLQTVDSHRD